MARYKVEIRCTMTLEVDTMDQLCNELRVKKENFAVEGLEILGVVDTEKSFTVKDVEERLTSSLGMMRVPRRIHKKDKIPEPEEPELHDLKKMTESKRHLKAGTKVRILGDSRYTGSICKIERRNGEYYYVRVGGQEIELYRNEISEILQILD